MSDHRLRIIEVIEDQKKDARIADLEALVVKVEQQRNTMTAERDDLKARRCEGCTGHTLCEMERAAAGIQDYYCKCWAEGGKS